MSSENFLPDFPALQVDALENSKPNLFALGQIVHTRTVAAWAQDALPDVLLDDQLWLRILIRAHVTGCWSQLPKEDRELNYRSLMAEDAGRIFSMFTILNQKIYVITEWDRSVTTVLLAEDY